MQRVKPLCLRPLSQPTQPQGFAALPLTPTTTEDQWNDSDTAEILDRQTIHTHSLLSSGSHIHIETDTDMNMIDCASTESSTLPEWPTTCHGHGDRRCNLSTCLNSTDTSLVASQACNKSSSVNAPAVSSSINNIHPPASAITHREASRPPSPISEFQAETKKYTGNPMLHPFQHCSHLDDVRIPSNISLLNSVSSKFTNKFGGLQEDTSTLLPPTNPEAGAFQKCSDLAANHTATSMARPPKKATIAMGFRADCDKCQRREPGHYSHIVYS
ncbi:hypothetical protein H112_08086 [Trichophyton rubrum D6]|uniref:Uncharacterized protein n=2 Tax=Trichophyton TaxID=5550 RepID=A0A022VR10_TRIRU|nr:hypothetical protein H100_08114 [Trichophyton rubrum MR850]EZF37561.1 hypothetical protein H102_08070 [Trichophyton rubrum CBS 100081]EZF48168.1 hypothetical protein H103_08097 [Trichophyton rubrum CBS 288.86]EZF58831.1 hypothetical protein H104_08044 [Trichophyton rubrum CBS 289.86]EZF69422.1 hypothetical protein H105_08096 [Trichophyton soudanense CBS 452.61]EZF80076.1 hypothetical protein H110_08098 [Trichophyton rubrum MR1448]EZF90754.1 hypothetical protein H113_08160 [Trichophyton rub